MGAPNKDGRAKSERWLQCNQPGYFQGTRPALRPSSPRQPLPNPLLSKHSPWTGPPRQTSPRKGQGPKEQHRTGEDTRGQRRRRVLMAWETSWRT